MQTYHSQSSNLADAKSELFNPIEVENIGQLVDIDPETFTKVVLERSKKGHCYTQIGDDTIVYTNRGHPQVVDELVKQYVRQAQDSNSETRPVLPPHSVELACKAYCHMIHDQISQTIFVAGERQSTPSFTREGITRTIVLISKQSAKKTKLESCAVKAEAVVQLFTVVSSSEGLLTPASSLYSEYSFEENGSLAGIYYEMLYLDTSKVKMLPPKACHGVRNSFQIFYALLSGASSSEKALYQLGDLISIYKEQLTIVDNERFEILKHQLKSIGIGRRQQVLMFKMISSIMHLQHLKFTPPQGANLNEACTLVEDKHSNAVCDFLGISHSFLESSLATKVQFSSRDEPSCVSMFLTVEEAESRSLAIASLLYERLFMWILSRINEQFSKPEAPLHIAVFDFYCVKSENVRNGHMNFAEDYVAARSLQWIEQLFYELCQSVFAAEGIRIPVLDAKSNVESQFISVLDKAGKNSLFAQLKHYAFKNVEPLREAFENKKFPGYSLVDRDAIEVNTPFAPLNASLADLLAWNRCDLERDLELLFTLDVSFNPFFIDLLNTSTVKGTTLSKPTTVTADHGFKLHALKLQIDRLFERSASWRLWRSFHLPGDVAEPEIQKLAEFFRLSYWGQKAKYVPFAPYPLTLDQFCVEFSDIMTQCHATDSDKRTRLLSFIQMLGLSTSDLYLGEQDIVFTSEPFYRYLTDNSKPNAYAEVSPSGSTISGNNEKTITALDTISPASFYGAPDAQPVFPSNGDWETESVNTSHYDDDTSVYQYSVDENLNHSRDTTLGNEDKKDWMMEAQFKPPEPEPKPRVSVQRKRWVCCTWCSTWWVPSIFLNWCGGMKRSDVRMAWREKLTLCILIGLLCCTLLFIIIGIPWLLCPPTNVKTTSEISSSKYRTVSNPYVILNGNYLKIVPVVNGHIGTYVDYNFYFTDPQSGVLGTDVSDMFVAVPNAAAFSAKCPGLPPPPAGWDNLRERNNNNIRYLHAQANKDYTGYLNQFVKGYVGWSKSDISKLGTNDYKLLYIYNNVYDFSQYTASSVPFLGDNFKSLILNNIGKDGTNSFEQLKAKEGSANATMYMQCINSLFYVGTIDQRSDAQCVAANYILLAMSIIIVLIIGVKFIAALQFVSRREPEEHDKFVICQVPCYTEGTDSLTRTLESLAVLRYDDKRKLIVVVCDGMIIGSGNDRPTPRIVLDILGVDPTVDPEPLSFLSIGDGSRQHNMAKVFSGLYETQGHTVPFLVLVKVGKPTERNKPGNRGKRDSQMLIMRFLNKVHFNLPMNPLELELYHQTKNVIGVSPVFYEYILMVDADTEVTTDALNRMVSTMIHDAKVMGLCGETRLANERSTWVTMIQVYEYFISHHMAKAFESLFGSVTCLPGCFCMYRVRSPVKNEPLLINPAVVEEYSISSVSTLHMKNLLSLGEDRYLTTLMLKHFPGHKLKFTQDAVCRTNAPERFSVLLSQRRRWINSTVHNLAELLFLSNMCGCCCFSMRFVVFMDLFATLVQPATILYLGFLIYTATSDNYTFPLISIIMIASIYGLQIIIFLLKRQWQHIGWMVIYILALPFYAVFLPIYSFWHFDDFSWGNTRQVAGKSDGKVKYVLDAEPFDPAEIPVKKWADYEVELWDHWEKNSVSSAHSRAQSGASVHSGASVNSYNRGGSPSVKSAASRPASVASFNAPSVARPHSVVSYGRPPSVAMYGSPSATATTAGPFTQFSSNPYSGQQAASSAPNNRNSISNSSQSPIMAPFHGASMGSSSLGSNLSPSFSATAASNPTAPLRAGFPSDQEILFELKKILNDADLMSLTKKKVRTELGEIFACDLSTKRIFINQCIDAILQNRL